MSKPSKSRTLPLRPDKTIDWLNKSRDEWKDKTLASKASLKVAKQAQKRARVSREQWKAQCEKLRAEEAQSELKIRKREKEISELEATIAQLRQENDELKKKFLLGRRIHE
jgi:hypothetical protein